MDLDLNETLNISTNVTLEQKTTLNVDQSKPTLVTKNFSDNLNSFNVQTTITQEKEEIFTSKEPKEEKARPYLESSKQLSIELVDTLETIDKFKKNELVAQKIKKELIPKTEYIQTIQVFPNSKESKFETISTKKGQSQVDLIQMQAICTNETQLNDKEEELKKLKSKQEKLNFNYERNENLSVEEHLVLQNDQQFSKEFQPKTNKANLQLQSNQAIQSFEILANEKENKKDFKKKLKTKHLTPLISTKEAVIIKEVESKDSSIDFEKGKLSVEQVMPVIDTMEALEISKPNFIESLRKQKKTVTISEQADFSLLENLNVEVGQVESVSTIEPFILGKENLSTQGELNLTDLKAIQEHKSLILEKEKQFKCDEKSVSNASKDFLIEKAIIVSLNEKVDSTEKFSREKTKKSKAHRDLSESRLKLCEIKDLQVKGSVENLENDILAKEKAILNLDENLSLQIIRDNHLEKESELNLPKIKRKSIKDRKVILKSRSLSVGRNLVFNKEESFNIPTVTSAKAQHELVYSNSIEQQQQDFLQSTSDFKSKPFKHKRASVSLGNLYSLQINLTNHVESEQNLDVKSFETTKILPIGICGSLNAAESKTVVTDYKPQATGKLVF